MVGPSSFVKKIDHFASRCHHNRHKEFLNASSDFESADEIEVETGEDSDEDSEEELTIESLEETLYELVIQCG